MTSRDKPELEGCYANYVAVGHNAFEFILNFGQLFEGSDEPLIHTRIVTAPIYAKAMLKTLDTAINQFEAAYGRIPEDDHPVQ